ncbi:MAG: M23 family metallopeptidase, partial [Nitrososphaera sp.]
MQKVFIIGVLVMVFVSSTIAGTKAPYMAGETWWCSRGQDQCGHISVYKYGFDFNWGTSSASDLNRPVVAPNSGIVATVYDGGGYNDGWGNTIVIKVGASSYDRLAHLQSIVVKIGEQILQGQVVGMCGTTGNSTGPHIHYQHQNEVDGNSVPWSFEDLGTPNGPASCSYS